MEEPYRQTAKRRTSRLREIFPQVCSICLTRLSEGAFPEGICSFCLSNLPVRPPERSYSRLMQPGVLGAKDYLPLYTCFYYEGAARKAIRELKFHERTDFGPLLGDVAAQFWQREARLAEGTERVEHFLLDDIIPIPLHETRLRERGYNQVEEICRRLAERIGVPVRSDLLVRHRYTSRQSETVSREDRLANVEGAFRLADETKMRGRRFLLVDDVLSTGATLWQAAGALRRMGAEVVLLAVASNKPHEPEEKTSL